MSNRRSDSMSKNEAFFWFVILLIFAPATLLGLFVYFLPYLIVIGIAYMIYRTGKNGAIILTSMISFSSFIQIILYFINEESELYVKIETSINLVSLLTMDTLIDLAGISTFRGFNDFTGNLIEGPKYLDGIFVYN